MVLAISIDRAQYRFDSTRVPRITGSGITDVGRIKIENWEYRNAFNTAFAWKPPNRSKKNCNIELRNVFFPTWVTHADVTQYPPTATLQNIGAEGYKGAYYNTNLSTTQCAIEAQYYQSNAGSVGISLQSGAIQDDYLAVGSSVEHCLIFGQNLLGSIRELGVFKRHFPYQIGDKAIIECTDSDAGAIIKYYLVKPSGRLILLRTTRSKLTGPPKAHCLLFSNMAYLRDVRIYNNGKASTSLETIGVLTRLQSWKDDYSFISNADTIQLADFSIEETFPASKNVLRALTGTRNAAPKGERGAFADFFEWHRNSQEFIFVDYAREDRLLRPGESDEFWARFATGFGDRANSHCSFAESVQILEVQRDDFVPIELDEIAPVIELYEPLIGGDDTVITADATDNVGVNYVQFFANGVQIGENVYFSETDNSFQVVWILSTLPSGDYDLQAIAFDFAENSTASNIITVTIP